MKSNKTSSVTIPLSMASLMSSTTLISGLCAVTSSEASGKDGVIGERIGGKRAGQKRGIAVDTSEGEEKEQVGRLAEARKAKGEEGEQK